MPVPVMLRVPPAMVRCIVMGAVAALLVIVPLLVNSPLPLLLNRSCPEEARVVLELIVIAPVPETVEVTVEALRLRVAELPSLLEKLRFWLAVIVKVIVEGVEMVAEPLPGAVMVSGPEEPSREIEELPEAWSMALLPMERPGVWIVMEPAPETVLLEPEANVRVLVVARNLVEPGAPLVWE